jgi:hypothetical protein
MRRWSNGQEQRSAFRSAWLRSRRRASVVGRTGKNQRCQDTFQVPKAAKEHFKNPALNQYQLRLADR